MFICFKRQLEPFMNIVQNMGKDFRIALVTDVTGVVHADQRLLDWNICGVFTVRHGGDPLDKEGVAGV